MSKGTRTYVTVYNFDESDLSKLDRRVSLEDNNFFENIVPFRHEWGDIAHIELEDLEFEIREQRLTFTCETKGKPPIAWLKAASTTQFFEDKLIVAASVNRYENYVEGFAIMSHDLLFETVLLDVDADVIGTMYENDEVDEIDEMIWRPIELFSKECEKLYIPDETGGEEHEEV